jgi:hypothetical protein
MFVDVEGAELEVLRGANAYIQANKPVMVVEVIPRQLARAGTSVDELHNLIVLLGYEAFSLQRAGLGEPDHAVVSGDWICIPNEQQEKAAAIHRAIHRMLRRCALLPCALGLNPIARKREREEAKR